MTTEPIYYYVVLRRDLLSVQHIIQASHASIEMGMRMRDEHKVLDEPLHVALLMVDSQDELLDLWYDLKMSGWYENRDFTVFFEPDREDGWTCLCSRPVTESERRMFEHLPRFVPYASDNPLDPSSVPNHC